MILAKRPSDKKCILENIFMLHGNVINKIDSVVSSGEFQLKLLNFFTLKLTNL